MRRSVFSSPSSAASTATPAATAASTATSGVAAPAPSAPAAAVAAAPARRLTTLAVGALALPLPHTLECSAASRAAALPAGAGPDRALSTACRAHAALAGSTRALRAARGPEPALARPCRALTRSAASQILSSFCSADTPPFSLVRATATIATQPKPRITERA